MKNTSITLHFQNTQNTIVLDSYESISLFLEGQKTLFLGQKLQNALGQIEKDTIDLFQSFLANIDIRVFNLWKFKQDFLRFWERDSLKSKQVPK